MGNTPQSGGLCLKLGFGARYFQPSSYDILVVFGMTYIIINIWSSQISFPTCQVRVVRFYQGAPPRLLLQCLLNHVCINFDLHFRLANSSPSSLPTLFANSLRRLSVPNSLPTSQMSVYRWTSTWDLPVHTAEPQPSDLPSSVCTAGPQPGTCPGQCALLDLNLGPAQLSVHRWTSTAK